MAWTFNNDNPIYLQICDEIKRQIISGEIKPDEKLTSVRDYADVVGVNPNTMQRAMSEVEREGLIYSVRTGGRFVTGNKEMIEKMRNEKVAEKIDEVIIWLNDAGLSPEDMAKLFSERIEKLRGEVK